MKYLCFSFFASPLCSLVRLSVSVHAASGCTLMHECEHLRWFVLMRAPNVYVLARVFPKTAACSMCTPSSCFSVRVVRPNPTSRPLSHHLPQNTQWLHTQQNTRHLRFSSRKPTQMWLWIATYRITRRPSCSPHEKCLNFKQLHRNENERRVKINITFPWLPMLFKK